MTTFNKTALVLLATGCMALVACSHEPKKAETTDLNNTSAATAMSGAAEYAVISFDKGSTALNPGSRQALMGISQKATTEGKKIDEIKVLAWADREYPAEGSAKASKQDVNLADKRADVITSYLKDDLNTKADIDEHNMAQRPGFFTELVKSDDYKLKRNFESTGAAPVSSEASDTQLIGSKASKAVVLIKYE